MGRVWTGRTHTLPLMQGHTFVDDYVQTAPPWGRPVCKPNKNTRRFAQTQHTSPDNIKHHYVSFNVFGLRAGFWLLCVQLEEANRHRHTHLTLVPGVGLGVWVVCL